MFVPPNKLLAVELRVAQRNQLLEGLVDLLDGGLPLRRRWPSCRRRQGSGLDRGQEVGNAGERRIGLAQVVLIGADVGLRLGIALQQALDALHLQGGLGILAGQLELVAGADLRFQLVQLRLVGVQLVDHLVAHGQVADARGGDAGDAGGCSMLMVASYNWISVVSRVFKVEMIFAEAW